MPMLINQTTLTNATITASQQLNVASTAKNVDSFTVWAPQSNAGLVYIGDSGVSATVAIPLAPGQSKTYSIDNSQGKADFYNLSSVYWIAATSGDKLIVEYTYRSSEY